MDTVKIAVTTRSSFRATEIVADLRNAIEALYFPMKSVGYWDVRAKDHRCPQAQLRAQCPHVLPSDDSRFVDYEVTVERDLDGVLDIYLPHAQVHIYLA